MLFRKPTRQEMVLKRLSSALKERENNDTPVLYGGVSKEVQYPTQQQQPQESQRQASPSLTGSISQAKSIKGYFGGGSGGSSGGGGGVPWGAIANGVKSGYNTILDKKDENGYDDYSDMEETIIYPLQGAAQGSALGPWGALGGALYGLGYSFKDDIGLENNNWLTDLIFPIGMGDEHQGLGISL